MKLALPFLFTSLTGTAIADGHDFMVCFDFGCKSTQPVILQDRQWQQVRRLFKPTAINPWTEKQQIRQAVALLEQFTGNVVGTNRDRAGNYPGEDIPFQQDCIDESTNTFQYIHALDQHGLLKWHQIAGRQQRIRWLFLPHWTAVVRDKSDNQLYAVDSWYQDNGVKPYFQRIEDWYRKDDFDLALNPE